MHFLDPNCDADPPQGAVIVETEVDFLRKATQRQSLLVRGGSLCVWARTFWDERRLEYRELASPRDQIMACSFGITVADAAVIAREWRQELDRVPQPWSARSILAAIFPADFWHEPVGQRHAAKFVTWMSSNSLHPCFATMIRNVAIGWAADATDEDAKIYRVCADSAGARQLLRQWLRIEEAGPHVPSTIFPLSVPVEFRADAESAWSLKIIASNGRFFDELRQLPVPTILLEVAASLTAKFFANNPTMLSEHDIRALQSHLGQEQFDVLRQLVPPKMPSAPPTAPAEVFSWFIADYLPYRQWAEATGTAASIARANYVARRFSDWYLEFYPPAIGRGDKSISFIRSGDIHARGGRTGVTFLIILDGLNYPDGESLKTRLVGHSERIGIQRIGFAFTAVPTITEVCKSALVYGITPRMAMQGESPSLANGILLPENTDPQGALQAAKEGDLFVWRIIEPDKTYHSKGDRTTINKKVSSLLDSIARRIADAVMAIPNELKVHGVITSDHGRLFGKSVRALVPPPTMESHQRAALGAGTPNGAAVTIHEDQSGAFAELNGPRFELPHHCAIALTDHCFLAAGGRTGTELFAHGGLFPEEVVVPWIEFGRDLKMPVVLAELRGKAKENTEGMMELVVHNAGDLALTVVTVNFRFGSLLSRSLSVNESVGAWDRRSITIPFKPWPSSDQISVGSAKVTLGVPTGDEFIVDAKIALESDGFYVRRDILGDLS